MIDLRDHSALIRECVAKESERDENWKWSVKCLGKSKVRIRWGYLDYLGEKDNCFILEMQNDDACGDWLWAKLPDGDHIECYMVVDGTPNPYIGAEQTIESGIRDAIGEIAYYAHSRY